MSKSVIALLLALASPFVLADTAADEEKVRAAIKTLVADAKIDTIADSTLPGFYEVVMGSQVVYVSADGKFLLTGSVWDIANKRDLTDARKSQVRKTALDAIGADKRIAYPAKDSKHTVTVFTDIDCGYCRRLHQQMADYNKLGISVEYLFFPRSGLTGESFEKAVTVWCSADRAAALTKSKAGEKVEAKTCPNPVTEEFELGMKIGVTGTPMVIAEDGTQIGGYLAPDAMLTRLDGLKNPTAAAANASAK